MQETDCLRIYLKSVKRAGEMALGAPAQGLLGMHQVLWVCTMASSLVFDGISECANEWFFDSFAFPWALFLLLVCLVFVLSCYILFCYIFEK